MVESTNKGPSRLGSYQTELSGLAANRPAAFVINRNDSEEPPTPNPLTALSGGKRLSLKGTPLPKNMSDDSDDN